VQSSGVLSLAFQDLREAALSNPPLASGKSGTLAQMADLFVAETSSVSVSDSYTVVTFTNPADLSTPSDIGSGFRTDSTSSRALQIRSSCWCREAPDSSPSMVWC
jgi:hypothetical protein